MTEIETGPTHLGEPGLPGLPDAEQTSRLQHLTQPHKLSHAPQGHLPVAAHPTIHVLQSAQRHFLDGLAPDTEQESGHCQFLLEWQGVGGGVGEGGGPGGVGRGDDRGNVRQLHVEGRDAVPGVRFMVATGRGGGRTGRLVSVGRGEGVGGAVALRFNQLDCSPAGIRRGPN